MPAEKSKRIVFEATPDLMVTLEETAASLGTTKIGTLRLAVAILSEVVRQAAHGGRLILREPDGHDRELWLPQITRCDPPSS
ncbi:MAG TPA: hypothetical protein VNE39_00050 [Planctomycetota bacterium]|nr:hypothetical protein [Planctomycetota bacterium]